MRTKFERIADGVYAVLGHNGAPNAVCVDGGDDGVVVIDSRFTPQHATEMMDELRAVSGAPVVALLNTHFHWDHTFGNPAIETDRIIAHQGAYAKLSELSDAYVEMIRQDRPDLASELQGVELRLPTETIDDEMELRVGDLTLEIQHPGRTAHTDGDLYIRIPERRVLIAADLVFNGIVPVMRDGSIPGLRLTLEELKAIDFDIVVPGHGEPAGPELIDKMIAFVDTVVEATEQTIEAGGDVESATKAALERTKHLLFAEERVGESVRLVVAEMLS